MKNLVLASFALLALLAACADSKPRAEDSKSNWLRACSDQSDCGDALMCECGVCTQPCGSSAVCLSHCPPNAQCAAVSCQDPGSRALAPSCGQQVGTVGPNVCLLQCERASDCGPGQRCAQNNCVGTGGSDAGTRDGSASPLGGRDGGGVLGMRDSGNNGRDSGLPPNQRDTGVPPITPDAGDSGLFACEGKTRSCCGPARSCDEQLVCHIDDTCIAPGTSDERSIATLASGFDLSHYTLAADSDFVYGVIAPSTLGRRKGRDQLVRWPVAGGEAQVLASGLTFPGTPNLLLDGDRLYFTAAQTANDVSYALLRIAKDGSGALEVSGTAGSLLVQNATHLYFANDGDSRVVRIAKADFGTLAAREQVYVSTLDAPAALFALALNSSKLFIGERTMPLGSDPRAFQVQSLALDTLAVTLVAGGERLTYVQPSDPLALYASDGFLVFCAYGASRVDLASLEIKLLSGYYFCTLAGDHLIASTDDGSVHDLDLSSGKVKAVTLPNSLRTPVTAGDSLYGLAGIPVDGLPYFSLLRITR